MDLRYYKTINKDTSQGIVGILKPTKNKTQSILKLKEPLFNSCTDYFFVKDDPVSPLFVFKIPKEVNTLSDHEFKVGKDMEELSICLPHFNRVFKIKRDVKCYIPDKLKKIKNWVTFNPFACYNCIRDILIMQYIPSRLTLLDYITKTNFSGCTESLIHQLILALFIAQQEKKFTHYDLHLENILIRKCFQRTFFLYKFLYEGVVIQRLVYTDGYFPVLFDYGFAYSKGLEGTSYNNSLFFTNKGYTSFMFDDVNDFKTLMVRLSHISNCPQKFKTITDNLFLKSSKLKFRLNHETGWIKSSVSNINYIISKRLEKTILEIDLNYKDGFIFKELYNIVDLFGILIKIPIGQNNFKIENLKNMVEIFLREWEKIDIWFNHVMVDDKLNLIKKIFETINELIMEGSKPPNCLHFKLKLFKIFDAYGDFIDIENVNYGQLLSSIVAISNFVEYIIYYEIKRYKKLFNFDKDGWTLFNSIENLIEKAPYNFKLNDSVVVFDCIEKSTSSFELQDKAIIEALNNVNDLNIQLYFLNNLSKYDIE